MDYDFMQLGVGNDSHPANKKEFWDNVYEVAVCEDGKKITSEEFDNSEHAKTLFYGEKEIMLRMCLEDFKSCSIELKKNGNTELSFDSDDAFESLISIRKNVLEYISMLEFPMEKTSDQKVKMNELIKSIKSKL